MDNVAFATKVWWLLGSALTLLLAVRLVWTGLARTYRWFFALLCFTLLRDLALVALPFNGNSYAYFYMATQGFVAILFALVIQEVYSLILRAYPAIKTFSRWMLVGAIVLSVILAYAWLYFEVSSRENVGPLLVVLMVERCIYSAYVLLTMIMSFFLVWFPVSLAKNVAYHALTFVVYFVSKAMVLLLRSHMTPDHYKMLDLTVLAASCGILLAWIVLFRPSGEFAETVIGHNWNRGEQERLLEQLRGINGVLARTGQQ